MSNQRNARVSTASGLPPKRVSPPSPGRLWRGATHRATQGLAPCCPGRQWPHTCPPPAPPAHNSLRFGPQAPWRAWLCVPSLRLRLTRRRKQPTQTSSTARCQSWRTPPMVKRPSINFSPSTPRPSAGAAPSWPPSWPPSRCVWGCRTGQRGVGHRIGFKQRERAHERRLCLVHTPRYHLCSRARLTCTFAFPRFSCSSSTTARPRSRCVAAACCALSAPNQP